jgi:hypothetical protein
MSAKRSDVSQSIGHYCPPAQGSSAICTRLAVIALARTSLSARGPDGGHCQLRPFCKHRDCLRRARDDPDNDEVTEISSWPDIDPEAFEVYRSWLYLRDIPRCNTDNEVSARSIRLIKTHRLADELDDEDFRDAVRNAIVDHSVLLSGVATKSHRKFCGTIYRESIS